MEAFNFRIIKIANGAEIIDSTLSTPYNSLTPIQMMDYINVENSEVNRVITENINTEIIKLIKKGILKAYENN